MGNKTFRGPSAWGGQDGSGGGGGGAPTDAGYVVTATNGTLSNETLIGAIILPPDVFANRPAAASVVAGSLFYGTDTKLIYRSTGAAWETYAFTGSKTIAPRTGHPLAWVGSRVTAAASTQHYFRITEGTESFSISKIAVYIGVSAGNICVSVYDGGATGPANRKATSGSVASPGTGWREISLGGSVSVNPLTDYLAVSSDDATTAFGYVGSPHSATTAPTVGLAYTESSVFPAPATAGSLATPWRSLFILVGVA